MKVFDMEEIRDPRHPSNQGSARTGTSKGVIETRQKLVSINVGDLWPGQEYRVPVRMVVPANRKAKGFHLTGGSSPSRLQKDARPNPTERELLEGGVGLVITVVQEPGTYGQRAIVHGVRAKICEKPQPKIQDSVLGLARHPDACHHHRLFGKEHFEKGKVAASGGSKNGASPSMAIIHDERMTAVHATVSPIWDSPLRLNDEKAWKELRASTRKKRWVYRRAFRTQFQRAMFLMRGGTWKDLQNFTRDISDQVFISRNLKALQKKRGGYALSSRHP